MTEYKREIDFKNLWSIILKEAEHVAKAFPLLSDYYNRTILQHHDYEAALSYILAEKLSDNVSLVNGWQNFLLEAIAKKPAIARAALKDLRCQLQSNASIKEYYTPLLYFGSYQALQCYRFSHFCWNNDQQAMANYIQARVISLYGVDIHPGAVIGEGIFMDHAIGIVIGETAVVEDDVTLFQNITLGGTGKGIGDRHPKIRKGAFIGAGAVIFGNIEVGEYAKVAGGAIVVKPVPAHSTVVGPIAKAIVK